MVRFWKNFILVRTFCFINTFILWALRHICVEFALVTSINDFHFEFWCCRLPYLRCFSTLYHLVNEMNIISIFSGVLYQPIDSSVIHGYIDIKVTQHRKLPALLDQHLRPLALSIPFLNFIGDRWDYPVSRFSHRGLRLHFTFFIHLN